MKQELSCTDPIYNACSYGFCWPKIRCNPVTTSMGYGLAEVEILTRGGWKKRLVTSFVRFRGGYEYTEQGSPGEGWVPEDCFRDFNRLDK